MPISVERMSKIAHSADDLYGFRLAIQESFLAFMEAFDEIFKRLEELERKAKV